ncbi:chemotaxis protein CheW [Sediminispirochaeta smaragdinae]|uniref:CheW protein n=1 Tax=Sediminispirochaeta smaragdinae (strain DSM 11293 / JCM 15392 / SEBR 4228) TaxID=573413 RepID=E1R2D4_SEDSS|nr:chemotaxis protein CheW [Sediminispirochaeta smaragdinae]ADK82494.1 CheW protein [Sediminispirochaeta smaragdinae DSM 11293]
MPIDNSSQYLTFSIDESVYAIPIASVREVLELQPITRLPGSDDSVLGIINVRGRSVPVSDVRVLFGLQPRKVSGDNVIIVLETISKSEMKTVGMLTDAVHEVLEISDSVIEEQPVMGDAAGENFIKGIGNQHDRFIVIVDIDRMFGET